MTENAAHAHHSLDYIEFGVTDLLAAKAFYGSAFGWTFNDYGPGPAYVGIRRNGAADGGEVGGFRLDTEVKPGGPFVLLYSADLEASAQAVRDAGCDVTEGPYDFPGGRRFHFRDPSGNELGVWSES
ncbi:glyoxalase/bleomycin resistance protein/dioxygenase [Arthrobacter sp. PAMC 25486]|uniref:VOC family protein n=1 Tax=Arthrobacter sp. PAMC 25486 TaxID=1494608 RepID=UPI000535E8B4|nr:VOC family protein [Arthrobacter sp. PAMC 25486]AIY02492.1 glyoxalase/bleomycin resistance protein/dioxygenase [Arthrobacter sp. PAMC 25486]